MKRHFYRNATYITTLSPTQTSYILRNETVISAYRKNKEIHLLACDPHNSPISDSTSTIRNLVAYDAYGYSPLDEVQPVAFNGEYFDAISSQYWLGMGYRSYLPTLRRFTCPDDFSPFDRGGVNAYAFVSGDPTNFSDPSGRWRTRSLNSKPVLITDGTMIALGKVVDNQSGYNRALLVGFNTDGMTYIKGHGDRSLGTIGGYKPRQVLQKMQDANLELTDGPIHLHSCKAGSRGGYTGWSKPVGQTMANLTGRPVYTYKKNVFRTHHIDGEFLNIETNLEIKNPKPIVFHPEKPSLLSRLLSVVRKNKN